MRAPWPGVAESGVARGPLRLRVAAPWVFVVLLGITLVVAHRFHLPRDGGWLDTYVYARAASGFLAHPGNLYNDAAAQLHTTTAVNAFIYPPSALIPFLPMVPLTRGMGVAWTAEVWSWIDTASLLAALVLLARRLGIGAERSAWVIAALLVTMPVLSEIDSGQVEGVVLLLLVLSWRRWPHTSSGVLLGAALALKPVAPWLLLLPLAMRRPRVSAAAAVTLLALNAPFLPFAGGGQIGFYLLHFLPYMATHVISSPGNTSPARLLPAWIGPLAPLHGAMLASLLLFLLRGAVVALVAREIVLLRHAPVALFAMALAAVPLLSPTAWAHYDVYMLPAVLVLLTARSARVRTATLAGVGACVLLNSVLDASTFHLAMYPIDLARDRSAANVLTVVQGGLLTAAALAAVVALGVVRLPSPRRPAVHLAQDAAALAG